MVFVLFTVSFVFLALLTDRTLLLRWPMPTGVSVLVSVALIGIGAITTSWSVFHFLKVEGTPVPFNPPPELVTSGPYRFARNPMLSGVFLILFGLGFGIKSLSLILAFTPIYILLNVWELKTIEEPELIKRLGEDYLVYRNRTPMFIPKLPRLTRCLSRFMPRR
jgi:protein-S-isoprenylcysteine O-methyltransferase Ste14